MKKHIDIIKKFNFKREPDNRLNDLSLQYIPFDKLYVDQSQIDSFSVDHLKEILSEFHPALLRASSVVLIDGKYYLWDGQHSATAAWIKGLELIPCMVFKSQSLEFKRISSVEKFDGRQLIEMFEQIIIENNIETLDDLSNLFQSVKDAKNE